MPEYSTLRIDHFVISFDRTFRSILLVGVKTPVRIYESMFMLALKPLVRASEPLRFEQNLLARQRAHGVFAALFALWSRLSRIYV